MPGDLGSELSKEGKMDIRGCELGPISERRLSARLLSITSSLAKYIIFFDIILQCPKSSSAKLKI